MEPKDQGREAALAGPPIYANPYIGGEAEAWFIGYREVPEAERGSRPDLKPHGRRQKNGGRRPHDSAPHLSRKPRRTGFSHIHLKGSTPKPWAVEGVGL